MKMIIDDKTIELPQRNMTEDEFFDFCQANKNFPLERDEVGNILVGEPTGFYGSRYEIRASSILYNWSVRSGTGEAVPSNAGFTLPNKAVRSPDAAWISNERLAKVPVADLYKFPHVCPEFIIEIRSRTDRLAPLKLKMEEYMVNGCLLSWLIDPQGRKVYIYRQGQSVETVEDFTSTLSGEELLPDFELDLNLFS